MKKIVERINKAQETVEEIFEKIREYERSEAETNLAIKELEELKYKEFQLRASEADYFSLDHVDQLNLPYDVLLFVSEKNIGKTTAIYRKMEEAMLRGRKSIFMRWQNKEVETCMTHFTNDKLCPFFPAKSGSLYYFFNKEEYLRCCELETKAKNKGTEVVRIKFSEAQKMGLKVWGFATYFRTCNTVAGGSYEDYEYIFVDEFISWANSEVATRAVMQNWAAFPSSVARNKKDLKVLMFGNLKSSNSQLLEYYGIKTSDKLRYVRRGFVLCDKCRLKYRYVWNDKCYRCENCIPPCRILYINADCLYRGVSRQNATTRQASPKDLATTLFNKVITPSLVVIPPDIFDDFKPIKFLCYEGANKEFDNTLLIEVREAPIEFESTKWQTKGLAVRVRKFEAHEGYDLPILTDRISSYNKYRNTTLCYSIKPVIKDLYVHYRSRKLYFADDDSLDAITAILKREGWPIELAS